MIEYEQHLQLPAKYVKTKILEFLSEDIPKGDVTTNSIINTKTIVDAEIQAVEKFIFVGTQIIPHFFSPKCKVNIYKEDGDLIEPKEILGTINGPAHIILTRERVMLNLIQRLCGIATEAKKYSQLARAFDIKILDTRKTTPGLRLFEKHAIAVGGAYNHRLNLSEGFLIKDNHIYSAGSVTSAIKSAIKSNPRLPLEIEVENLDQIQEALKLRVDGFLLDNMPPSKIKKAIAIIRNSSKGGEIFIEASGGINNKNINLYLNTGINAISIGALTHSVKNKDIRLEFIS